MTRRAGLDAAGLARRGERFYRMPGSGLGWSIVRRIAAVHQARVDVGRSARLGGLAVVITFGRVDGSAGMGESRQR
jgi:two-component system sensor histidine kinase QseC